MNPSIVHETFVLERRLQTNPARLFEAYADVDQRVLWAAPAGDGMLFEESNFTIGAGDRYRCGPQGDLRFLVHVQYQEIVPGERIVYVERVSTAGTPLFAALVSLEFMRDSNGTRLVLTDQMASWVGPDMIEGAKKGTHAALDQWVALAATWE